MNFDVFGDKTSVNNREHSEPPEITVRTNQCMSGFETENIIETINGLCKRAVSCIKAAKIERVNNINNLSWAAYLLEKALISVRMLSNEFGHETEDTTFSNDLDNATIQVNIKENLIILDFPILFPKRKPNLKTQYYPDVLKKAIGDTEIPSRFRHEHITIVFLHCYEKSHATWAKKDHDNIDLKWIIDAMNDHFFIDDGPFRTSLFNHSCVDIRDHTLIYLVPTCDIGSFLIDRINKWEIGDVM
jgi:Holliday junction resolvase RusA-like endonuclease